MLPFSRFSVHCRPLSALGPFVSKVDHNISWCRYRYALGHITYLSPTYRGAF
jgi:hypothetical protein